MKILYIYAHPNEQSYNSLLRDQALAILTDAGHSVEHVNLYQSQFNAIASWQDFKNSSKSQYMLAQSEAYQEHTLSMDILEQLEKVNWADHLIFQFPLWWFSVPAILKGWFDRVLVKGATYDTGKIMENGLLKGKSAFLIVTTHSPENSYQTEGMQGATLSTFLYPIHHTLNFVGIKTYSPFVIHQATNIDISRQHVIKEQLQNHLSIIGNE